MERFARIFIQREATGRFEVVAIAACRLFGDREILGDVDPSGFGHVVRIVFRDKYRETVGVPVSDLDVETECRHAVIERRNGDRIFAYKP